MPPEEIWYFSYTYVTLKYAIKDCATHRLNFQLVRKQVKERLYIHTVNTTISMPINSDWSVFAFHFIDSPVFTDCIHVLLC